MDLSDLDLSVPADWYVIDGDAATRLERAAGEVAARIASRPELAPYREEITQVLVGFGEDAEEQGAMACAALWEPEPTGPVVANITVLLVEPLGPGDPATEADLAADMVAEPDEGDIGPREVTKVDLPVGPATRLRYLRQIDEPGAPHAVFDVTQFWIPLARRQAHDPVTLVVSASTPTLHAGDAVAEAAATVAQSVAVG